MNLELWDAERVFVQNGEYEKALICLKRMYAENHKGCYPMLCEFRDLVTKKVSEAPDKKLMGLLREGYKLSARDYLDDFCIFTEWNRPLSHKFYLPRRKGLLPIVRELQRLADDELDILCISTPPGVGKTGLAVFYLVWCAGRNPELGMLGGSHNAAFLRGVYDECLREMDGNGDYLWREVFPEYKVVGTNAQDMKIDVGKKQRFSTFQFSSIGSGNAGKVRAIQLLYCDDLIEGIEEALSKERLDKKWQLYTTDLRQRKQGKCKELHIATRWSVNDVIGRLQDLYRKDKRAAFLTMPALNEKGESNFDYGGTIGFTTEFYKDIMHSMDEASWKALYMNEPIEREGLLYMRDDLRRFYELPDEDPDAIIGVCDPAEGHGDDSVLPVGYVYGQDHYIVGVVCNDSLPDVTIPMMANLLYTNRVQACQFESNAAGGGIADKVENLLKERCDEEGGRLTHITKKRTQSNKETKIIVNSPWVKEHCLFLDDSRIEPGSDYQAFLRKLCSYSVKGKNKHDDVPDVMAQYALYVNNINGNQAKLIKRVF